MVDEALNSVAIPRSEQYTPRVRSAEKAGVIHEFLYALMNTISA